MYIYIHIIYIFIHIAAISWAAHISPLILLKTLVSPRIVIFPHRNGHLAEAPKGSGKTDARFKKKNLAARGSWRSWGLGTSESVFFAIWLGLNGHFWGLIFGKVDNFGEVGAVFSTVAPAECGWTVAQGVFPPCKVSGKGSQPQAMKRMGWSNTCFNIMRQCLLVWKLPTLVKDTCEIHQTCMNHTSPLWLMTNPVKTGMFFHYFAGCCTTFCTQNIRVPVGAMAAVPWNIIGLCVLSYTMVHISVQVRKISQGTYKCDDIYIYIHLYIYTWIYI